MRELFELVKKWRSSMNEPLKQRTQERQQLLATFDLITEEQLAMLLDVEVKSSKNRDQRDLPAFSKVGNKRLSSKPMS